MNPGTLNDFISEPLYTAPRFVMAGVAAGIGMSLALVRLIETQRGGMTAYDPVTLAATTVLLTMTAAIACWISARRAARVDPIIALRVADTRRAAARIWGTIPFVVLQQLKEGEGIVLLRSFGLEQIGARGRRCPST